MTARHYSRSIGRRSSVRLNFKAHGTGNNLANRKSPHPAAPSDSARLRMPDFQSLYFRRYAEQVVAKAKAKDQTGRKRKGRSPMEVLILGAAGMVGRKLTERLVTEGHVGGREISGAILHDVVEPSGPRRGCVPGRNPYLRFLRCRGRPKSSSRAVPT